MHTFQDVQLYDLLHLGPSADPFLQMIRFLQEQRAEVGRVAGKECTHTALSTAISA